MYIVMRCDQWDMDIMNLAALWVSGRRVGLQFLGVVLFLRLRALGVMRLHAIFENLDLYSKRLFSYFILLNTVSRVQMYQIFNWVEPQIDTSNRS
jgi:hypothetical protein